MATTTYSPAIQSFLSRRTSVLTKSPHTAPPTMTQLLGNAQANNPNRSFPLIVSCADPRVVPEAIFGLGVGEAAVIRNAGGDVQNGLPDILAIDQLARFTDVCVVRHTDCGTTFFRDDDVRADIKAREGMTAELKAKVDGLRFGGVDDGVAAALKRDVEFLRTTPLMRPELREKVVGFVYDLETGEVREV